MCTLSNLLTAFVTVYTPTPTPIVATLACGRVKLFQLSGQQVDFVVTDANNPNSPIAVKKGHSYTFSAGYTPGENVGSFVVATPTVNNNNRTIGSLDNIVNPSSYIPAGNAGADGIGPWAFGAAQT